MICIIAGHLCIAPVIEHFVYTFHVPMFFLISGYFFSYKKGKTTKKLWRYARPYLFTVVALFLYHLIRIIVFSNASINNILDVCKYWIIAGVYGSGLRGDFFGYDLPIIGAVWFLLALMWAIAMMTLLCLYRLNEWLRCAIVLGIFLLGYFTAVECWLPFSFQAGCAALLFVFIGYEYKRRVGMLKNNKKLIFLAVILWGYSIYLSYSDNFLAVVRFYFPHLIYDILGACAASYLIILFCKKIPTNRSLGKFLQYIGQNSAIVLCFHLIELHVLREQWSWLHHSTHNIAIAIILIMAGKLCWAYLAIKIVNRVKTLRFFFA